MGNFSNWGEGIIFSLIFFLALVIILGNFNILYNKNYNLELESQVNDTKTRFVEYVGDSQTNINTGEVQTNANEGITLKSSYGIMKDFTSLVWTFLSGGWIEQNISYLNLGESGSALAWGLRILWVVSLVFAMLYALFKVVI